MDLPILQFDCFAGKPHNPLINAGAIIVTSLLKMGKKMADRYDFVSLFLTGQY